MTRDGRPHIPCSFARIFKLMLYSVWYGNGVTAPALSLCLHKVIKYVKPNVNVIKV